MRKQDIRRSRNTLFVASLVLVGLVGYFDYKSAYQVGFSVLYLLPIVFGTWTAGRTGGVAASFASAATIFMADWVGVFPNTDYRVQFGNGFIVFGSFLVIAMSLDILKRKLERARKLASLDPLTMAPNRRYFEEAASTLISRSRRKGLPFALAYLDVDNFKNVNDTGGHIAGDELLKKVAGIIDENIRPSDVLARLGGDEFAILLGDTDAESANSYISRIHKILVEKIESDSPVSFSIGVVTFLTAPKSTEEMLDSADRLMYSIKNSTKNMMKSEIYHEPRSADRKARKARMGHIGALREAMKLTLF